jgi:hypothetical protein
MESRDRVKKIAKCAEESNDLSMMKIIESDSVLFKCLFLHKKHVLISTVTVGNSERV